MRHYEGLPPAASVEQSIILAQRQMLRDLERRKQSVAAIQLLITQLTGRAAA